MNLFTKEGLIKATFNWRDLSGKTLQITVATHFDDVYEQNLLVVIGQDTSDGKLYHLYSEQRDIVK